ncbi:MAG TPA: macro domain-containing protein [Trichormus sp.]
MTAFTVSDASLPPDATPVNDHWTSAAAADAYQKGTAPAKSHESGGFLSVLGDLAIGVVHAVENPVKLAEEALIGVGTAVVAAALAPEVAIAATVGAGIYGAYELATHAGGWVHAAGVVANASDHTEAEVAAAHQTIQGVSEGAIDLAAAGAGGLTTMALNAAPATAVEAALADAPAAAIAPTGAALADAPAAALAPTGAALTDAPAAALAPTSTAAADAPAMVPRPVENVTAADTAASAGSLMPRDVSVVSGDIVQSDTDAIITAVNPGGMWFGGVDGAIQRTPGGGQFYTQLAQQADLVDGQAVIARGTGEGPIKNVVFAVDDLQQPLKNIITNALVAADKAGFKSVSIPAMRMGLMKGTVEVDGPATVDQMVRGVQEFMNQGPQSIKKINFVVYNAPALKAALQQDIMKLSLPAQST